MSDYDIITNIDALQKAWFGVLERVNPHSSDAESYRLFGEDLETNLRNLAEKLAQKRYVPKPAIQYKIPKDGKSGEYRSIMVTSAEDKIVQRAFTDYFNPIAEKFFYENSFAYRKGKGSALISALLTAFYKRKKFRFAITGDICHYFENISRNSLMNIFAKKLSKDPAVLDLLKLWLYSGYFYKRDYFERKDGLELGFIVSPFLSNLYLDDFDHHFSDGKDDYFYIRYADNFIFLADDLSLCEQLYKNAEDYLKNHFGLKLNADDKQLKSFTEGFDFLGIHYQDDTIGIAVKKMDKMKNKIYRSSLKFTNTELLINEINQHFYHWQYHYQAVNRKEHLKEIDNYAIKQYAANIFKNKIGCNIDDLAQLTLFEKYKPATLEKQIKAELQILQSRPLVTTDEIIKKQRKTYKKESGLNGEWVVLKHNTKIFLRDNKMVMESDKEKTEIPLSKVGSVQIGSKNNSITTNLIEALAKEGIAIHIVNHFDLPIASILPTKHASLNKTKKQIEAFFNGKAAFLTKEFIIGKIKNQKNLVTYFAKYHLKQSERFKKMYETFIALTDKTIADIVKLPEKDHAKLQASMMGLEGNLARQYWEIIGYLIKPETFPGRVGQNAKDKVNAMLNYGYAILYNRIHTAVIKIGLNPQYSYLHKEQDGKPTLVFDLIEQFRASAVDRVVVALVNKKIKIELDADCRITDACRKVVAEQFLNRLHSYFNYEKTESSIMEQINLRVRMLKEYLCENGKYKSFVMKT